MESGPTEATGKRIRTHDRLAEARSVFFSIGLSHRIFRV
jgi:hypothetical protein